MKSLAIDSSSIISLATNSLLWILEPLKKQFQGDFYITDSVKQEVINRPLSTKRFKLEALMIKEIVEEIYGEFLKFDLRNGELRKKSDAIKWNLNKLEDLTLSLELNKK